MKLQNAVDDIIQKTNEVKQLAQNIQECLDLLKIIGVILS